MEDGLAQMQVLAMAEDRAGFLWLGTKSGVSRFDGHRFESFLPRDGVPAAQILAIHSAPNGDVFFGSDGTARPSSATAGSSVCPPPAGSAAAG